MTESSPRCVSDPGEGGGLGGLESCGTGQAGMELLRYPGESQQEAWCVADPGVWWDWGESEQEDGSGVQDVAGYLFWLVEKGSEAAADFWSEVWSCPFQELSASDSSNTATPEPTERTKTFT